MILAKRLNKILLVTINKNVHLVDEALINHDEYWDDLCNEIDCDEADSYREVPLLKDAL